MRYWCIDRLLIISQIKTPFWAQIMEENASELPLMNYDTLHIEYRY